MKKIIIRILFLVVVLAVLSVAALFVLKMYAGNLSVEHREQGGEYVERVVRSYQVDDLTEFNQFLHPDLVEYLATDEGVRVSSLISEIGDVTSVKEVKWLESKTVVSTKKGQYEFSNYEVKARFIYGDGLIKITIIPFNDTYMVTNFRILSDFYNTLE